AGAASRGKAEYVGPGSRGRSAIARRRSRWSGGRLLGSERLVNQHDRDSVTNRVVPLAFLTHQVIALPRDGLLVERAGQNSQQLRVHLTAQLRRLGRSLRRGRRRRPALGITSRRAPPPPEGGSAKRDENEQ